MAEAKFLEAQKAVEVLLVTLPPAERRSVLPLYHDLLQQQQKSLPAHLLLELAEDHLGTSPDQTIIYLNELGASDRLKFFRRYTLLKIAIAAEKGMARELYDLLSSFQLYLYEKKAPAVPEKVLLVIEKFFKKDFQLKLQQLALTLQLSNHLLAELIVKELIEICIEKAAPKGIREKFSAIGDVLQAGIKEGPLLVYLNFCRLTAAGITEKTDYKKLAEIIIFFDDFKSQAHVLNLLDKLELREIAHSYAVDVRNNQHYDFVYFDKFYSHLKKYFVDLPILAVSSQAAFEAIDLTLEQAPPGISEDTLIALDFLDDEANIIMALKYGSYSPEQLLDIATNFIQSHFYHAGLKAAEMINSQSMDQTLIIKANYLRMICFFHLRDYRAALDLSLQAQESSSSESELLSFLYAQSEAYLKLGEMKSAKRTLQKIVSIHADYRLAKEKLEKLNEI